jgi:hypothetical protein
MRHAALLLSLVGALAFGQSARNPGGIPLPAAKPALCAIPLLNVKPGPVKDRMPIVKPPVSALQESRELKLRVPAPACDEKLFQNK